MQSYAADLIALGLLFLTGLAADQLGARSRLPRVTLLLICGLLAGSAGFDLIPESLAALYPIISVIALSMVAFLLGGELSLRTLSGHGRAIVVISVMVVLVTQLTVSAGLAMIGMPLAAALMVGALATATDPAATLDVIRQGRASGDFPRRLKGIVAIDDAWGVLLFGLVAVLAGAVEGNGSAHGLLGGALVEIAGSVALGLAVGLPGASLTGRLSGGEPLRIEALGLVFLTAGLSLWLDLSYLIAGMTAGAVIVNLAHHHKRAFREIEHIEWPFMIVFFILAGASLDLSALWAVGPLLMGYVALRVLGRVLGGWAGAALAATARGERPWYGPALLPQAGVAIGMALIAGDLFPQYADMITALAIGATVVFELAGPLAAAYALRRVRDSRDQSAA
ncbi:cation:proton antiporter [Ruegeria pomeroyi]|uniref:Na(+)/H(+) antiporter-like protein n=2 Tax=Ruegeria pomeroyi TaxID=89184 RepID=Q5LRP6_RUEPO|nr:cation:proton antiporter [Ruegeria pomeroyi]AAV95350.1 Na(+)/H(+) antiporter-like protein [Ruegeria pomeroyi DSS-3]NVK96946.1 cation:proton antiporter [Ruegeria pomeroyi]NVL02363.1 cation:proton antiporter [Ruegeria pomeroyi]QWV08917.1 cation:proton antiporter [Ruegeria pomeroyi]